uniref:group II intron maturase-specific domain-containing protein n=1 Tax=Streptomyces sp. CHD11 TaxID=2741325 RepID=UPI001BFC498E
MQHARDRIRKITARRRLLLHPQVIVEDLNLFLRGWMAYFRYGHSARRFSMIGRYTRERVAHLSAESTGAAGRAGDGCWRSRPRGISA